MSGNYVKRPISLVDKAISALTYEPYFGLSEKPFSLNADPRFVFDSPAYAATRESLLAGIRRREGLLVLTGQIGTGKTTLCRTVLRDLGRNTYSSLVPDPFASREDLLKMLLIDFGASSIEELTAGRLHQASRTELGYVLSGFLHSLDADAFAVVVLDEAQNLSLPLIEETRILFDTFGANGRLQIVFAGQPELHGKLKLPEMRQVDQRVCGYHRLAPMTREAVSGYIQHRLHAAGGQRGRVLFPPAIVDELHRRSGGVPRLINRLCDRALHLAFERQIESVNREILDAALIELGSATLSPTWDSIIHAEPPQPQPAAPPAPPPAPVADAVDMTPPIDDHVEDFNKEIDHWVAKDLTPSPPPPHRRTASPTRRREAPARISTNDWPRDVRSETYVQRLWRIWSKRAVMAVAVLMTLGVAMVGISLLADRFITPEAPAAPAAPAPVVSPIGLPEAPPPAAPVASASVAAPSSIPDSAEYFVAVGLFASPERADQIVDALTQAGLPAMQRPFQLRRQQVQQIVLGPFFNRADAAADLRRLRALGGYDDARLIDSAREPAAR